MTLTQAADREKFDSISLEKSLYERTDPSEFGGENCELEDFISLYAQNRFLPFHFHLVKNLQIGLQNCYCKIKVCTNRISATPDFMRNSKKS